MPRPTSATPQSPTPPPRLQPPCRRAAALLAAACLGLVTPLAAGCADYELPGDVAADSTIGEQTAALTIPNAFLVRSGASLTRGGTPYKALGFNKFDLFSNQEYLNKTPGSAISALNNAQTANIDYLRINGAGHWPSYMSEWMTSPTTYWQKFDSMVAAAKSRGIQLVPVIMWNVFIFADLAGQPLNQLFVSGSTARTLLFNYAQQLVSRYKNEYAISFWELTNEMNLYADIDIADNSNIATSLGTPASRGPNDNFTFAQMNTLLQALATSIKGWDPNHLISSGFAAPRPSAYNLWKYGTWTADTATQMRSWVVEAHKGNIDIVSMHLYNTNTSDGQARLGYTGKFNPDVLVDFKAAATQASRPLFLGELGDSDPWVNEYSTQAVDPRANFTRRSLLKIVDLRIPLSAVWTWQYESWTNSVSAYTIWPGDTDPLIGELITFHNTTDGWLQGASTTPSTTLNLLNATFETDANLNTKPDNWETIWRNGTSTGYYAIRYADTTFQGSYSMRMFSGTGDAASKVYALSDAVTVTPSSTVVLSAAMRHNLVGSNNGHMTLVQYNSAGTELTTSSVVLPPSGGWKYKVDALKVTLLSTATKVRVRFGVGGAATGAYLHVDDVRLSKL